MSLGAGNLLLASAGDEGYNLTRSLRTRASASAYLNRTPASASNRKTWTWSAWVKRGVLGTRQVLFSCNAAGNDNQRFFIEFGNSSDDLSITAFTQVWKTTTQVFRDPSAWYHIVVNIDTTQATASNRIKLYINGAQVTAFAASNDPSLNADLGINQASAHSLGQSTASSFYFDGYLTEVNFIDGQALTPSSFGSTNALTGVWQTARYTGTYGTNGFYLPFTDNSALTTSSNVGLGKDFSGNGNYWTTNNISITAGVTYDSMTDVPTLTSATASNFAVLNPLINTSVSGFALTNGNLTFATTSTTSAGITFNIPTTGKWYWEATVTALSGGVNLGIYDTTYQLVPSSDPAFATVYGYGYNNSNGNKMNGSGGVAYGASYTTNDVIGVAFDAGAGTLTFYKNNTLQGTAFTGLTGKTYSAYFAANSSTWAANFGQRPFSYTPPSGFLSLNTFNLPTSTIVKGNTVMDATLVSGNSTYPRNITNAAAFKPDLLWIKSRSNPYDHYLMDSIRGTGNTHWLSSNLTAAEGGSSTVANVTSLNSDGFTIGAASSFDTINQTSMTNVAWQWQAGQGSTSSNTNGTITSTVSVNASAGFSVVTYTGNGSAGATVGHGLGVAPSLVIVKNRNTGSTDWPVYHKSIGATNWLALNTAQASAANTVLWNDTSPTSSVFSVGASLYVNGASSTFVAYCWTPIEGYSSFGKYIGNGSTDGVFVYLGFRPRWFLVKQTDVANSWFLFDSARDPYNASQNYLAPNLSNAESVTLIGDFLSNGIKMRSSNAAWNGSGNTYIYMAFAESPFRNSLAR